MSFLHSCKLHLVVITFFGILITACNSEESKDDKESNRPNILLIIANDSGYSDFSCNGEERPIPNIVALANVGLQLTDFHVAPNCAPTRSALLSGMDNQDVLTSDFRLRALASEASA